MNVLGAAAIDAALICACALLLCRLLARRPAALRHVILATSLAAAAAAPLFETSLPRWELPVLSSSSQVTSTGLTFGSESPAAPVDTVTGASPTTRISWTTALAAVWSVGFLVVMAGLLAGILRLIWLTRRCLPIASGAWREQTEVLSSRYGIRRPVVVLQSDNRSLLLTWGLVRPCIVVPAGAASWTVDRITVVLEHEIAHIRRRDWLVPPARLDDVPPAARRERASL
jgi:beta-lactamase regulating signal transducer with metallopeptidase domain